MTTSLTRFGCMGLALFLATTACSQRSDLPHNAAEAAAALKAGRPDLVVEGLKDAAEKSPQAWETLAAACAMLPCDGAQVEQLFTPAAESQDPAVVLLAARAAGAADRLGVAFEWLEQGQRRHPKVQEMTIESAKLLARMGRYEQSADMLRPLVGQDPRVLNLIGYAELLAGRLEAARAYLERSVAEARNFGKEYAPAHYHLGRYHLAMGDLDAARREFQAAREANPDHLEAHYFDFTVAELSGQAVDGGEAREGFARLYRASLGEIGALGPMPEGPTDPSHRDDIESWHKVPERTFSRALAAGSSIEVALHLPAGERALFRVRVESGPGAGESLLEVIHQAPDSVGHWVPHLLEIPPGNPGDESVVEFSLDHASAFPRFFGADPPEGAGFSEPAVLAPAASRSSDTRPNILLISLDTLRADRVSAYGAARETTPTLDRLAANGVRFDQAESANNWTLPSHYSIFSGLTPRAHGVLPDMSQVRGYLFPDRALRVRSSGRETMLAEALSAAGYRSAAVTENGWISARFGFDQGFRIYRSDLRGSLPRTLAASVAQLESAGERGPWFLFVHTYTPHQPYHAPEEHRLRWADSGHVGFAWPAGRVPISDYYRFRAPYFPPAPSDIEAYRDLYDGQVRWADSMVAELVSWLESRGLLEQTIIAVTSDHGEEIFERGQFDHGDTLYEEVTRVPLIVSAPGLIPSGRVVDGPVSLIDLPATLLDLVGLEGRLGQGESLRPLWEEHAGPSQRIAFAEGIGFDSEELVACWQGSLKYLRRGRGPDAKEELYDLQADPGERRNLAASRPADVARLREIYQQHLVESDQIQQTLGSGAEELDEETIERLKSLGYAQ